MDASTSESSGIQIQVAGHMEIAISDDRMKTVGRCSRASLHYFTGRVKLGNSEASWIDACILAFDSAAVAELVHYNCTRFHHPYVMRPLGHGKEASAHSKRMFVAFPPFSSTLGECVKQTTGVGAMGRFSEKFIQIVSQTVKGLVALQKNNFDCPDMLGKHVAIVEENDCLTVKIWNFQAHTSGKYKGWSSLADLLREAAKNNYAGRSDSLEITDLCTKMTAGKLTGLDILNHSALLTVRQKFDNILALNLHAQLNHKKEPAESSTALSENQSSANLSQKKASPASAGFSRKKSKPVSQELYDLGKYLDVPNTQRASRPYFIENIRRKGIPRTFRRLLDELRDIIEHENEYFPPEMTRELTPVEVEDGKIRADLEQYFRKTWTEGYLKIQLWAVDHNAKLPG